MGESELHEEILSLKAEILRLRKSLSKLTPPLSILLRRRGFRIYRKEPSDDLLLPPKRSLDGYYKLLHKYSFRLFLRDAIKHQDGFSLKDVARYAAEDVTSGYIDHLLKIGLITKSQDSYLIRNRPVKSFGPTLEWFLCEILKREFGMEAVWGIKLKGSAIGGDCDLLAKVDGSILYMEIKSSPPKQIYSNEISAFLARISELNPLISIFFMDTELRMKDKIVPMFEEELKKKMDVPPPVVRLEKELFRAGDNIFIINSNSSIVDNIESVLKAYFQGSRLEDIRCPDFVKDLSIKENSEKKEEERKR